MYKHIIPNTINAFDIKLWLTIYQAQNTYHHTLVIQFNIREEEMSRIKKRIHRNKRIIATYLFPIIVYKTEFVINCKWRWNDITPALYRSCDAPISVDCLAMWCCKPSSHKKTHTHLLITTNAREMPHLPFSIASLGRRCEFISSSLLSCISSP